MTTEKVSVSIDGNLLAEARSRSRGESLSAYVSKGLMRQILADRQRELIEEWEAKFGLIPEEALAEMASLWPD